MSLRWSLVDRGMALTTGMSDLSVQHTCILKECFYREFSRVTSLKDHKLFRCSDWGVTKWRGLLLSEVTCQWQKRVQLHLQCHAHTQKECFSPLLTGPRSLALRRPRRASRFLRNIPQHGCTRRASWLRLMICRQISEFALYIHHLFMHS